MWTVGQTGEKKTTFFKQKQTRVEGALGPVHAYRDILRTENPDETKFSGDKNVRFRKRLQIAEYFENAGLSF